MLHEKMDKSNRDARLERDARKAASKYDFVKARLTPMSLHAVLLAPCAAYMLVFMLVPLS
jgi:hypothetical protein